MFIIRHHVLAPVLRLVETSEQDVSVLDVQPGIQRYLLAPDLHVNRDQVAELEAVGRILHFLVAFGRQDLCQVTQRNGGHDRIAAHALLLAFLDIEHFKIIRAMILDTADSGAEQDITAAGAGYLQPDVPGYAYSRTADT